MTYIWGIVVIAFLAVGGTALWYRGEAIGATALAESEKAQKQKVEAALAIAVDANEAQQRAIKQMKEQNEREQQILADIAHKLAVNNQLAVAAAKERADLEVNDETVREYFSTPIPAAYERLLNRGRGSPAGSGGH